MRKIIGLSLILCSFCSASSQDLIQEIQKLTLENDSLQKQVIRPLQDSILNLHIAHTAEISKMQGLLNTLEKDKAGLDKKIQNLEKGIADLNKNKVQIERDSLQKQVERLTATIVELNQEMQEKEKLIGEERRIGEQKAITEKETGKNEMLALIVHDYTNKTFDDLIKTSTKLSVQRDRQLAGDNAEAEQILSDLENYFYAKELLDNKMDAELLNNARTQLNQIVKQSELLDQLKEDIAYAHYFYDELKKTIEKLVDLDRWTLADGDTAIQKLKFHEILSEVADYMYNYYSYGNYPYLSDIIFEIIKRKQRNADADITDLLIRLQ